MGEKKEHNTQWNNEKSSAMVRYVFFRVVQPLSIELHRRTGANPFRIVCLLKWYILQAISRNSHDLLL